MPLVMSMSAKVTSTAGAPGPGRAPRRGRRRCRWGRASTRSAVAARAGVSGSRSSVDGVVGHGASFQYAAASRRRRSARPAPRRSARRPGRAGRRRWRPRGSPARGHRRCAAASATPKPSIASATRPGVGGQQSAARSAVPVTVETVSTGPSAAPMASATARTSAAGGRCSHRAEAELGRPGGNRPGSRRPGRPRRSRPRRRRASRARRAGSRRRCPAETTRPYGAGGGQRRRAAPRRRPPRAGTPAAIASYRRRAVRGVPNARRDRVPLGGDGGHDQEPPAEGGQAVLLELERPEAVDLARPLPMVTDDGRESALGAGTAG